MNIKPTQQPELSLNANPEVPQFDLPSADDPKTTFSLLTVAAEKHALKTPCYLMDHAAFHRNGLILKRVEEEVRGNQRASCTPTPGACNRCRCRHSGRAGLESFALLDGPDKRSDGREVFGVEVRDGWHVSEVPVVLSDASERSDVEGPVGVMGWFVEDREVRRPLVGAAEVDAMAFGARLFVQIPTCGKQIRGDRLDVRSRVASSPACSKGQGNDEDC